MSIESKFGVPIQYVGALIADEIKTTTLVSESTTIDGNLSVTGNILADGSITADGSIQGATILSTGNITSDGSISVVGAINAGSVVSTGNITCGGSLTTTGSVTAASVVSSSTISAGSNITTDGSITAVGAINASSVASSGALTCTTIDTGQGANECYAMDQDVTTSDDVRFNTLSVNGSNDSSAIATFTSSNRGILPPRMTTAEREAIVSPADGLVVFDEDENRLYVKASSAWTALQPVLPSLRDYASFRYDNSGGDIFITTSTTPIPLSLQSSNGISLNANGMSIELNANKLYLITATFYPSSYNGSASLLLIESEASSSAGGSYSRIGSVRTLVPKNQGGGSYITTYPCTTDTFVRIRLRAFNVDTVTLSSDPTTTGYSSVVVMEI